MLTHMTTVNHSCIFKTVVPPKRNLLGDTPSKTTAVRVGFEQLVGHRCVNFGSNRVSKRSECQIEGATTKNARCCMVKVFMQMRNEAADHVPYWCHGLEVYPGSSPAYLRDLCHPTPGTRGCSSLRSSAQGLLFVPFARTSTTQARAFSVVGPSVWNGLPLSQRLLPHSTLVSKLFFLAAQGSGALLSSNLEGALYKSP